MIIDTHFQTERMFVGLDVLIRDGDDCVYCNIIQKRVSGSVAIGNLFDDDRYYCDKSKKQYRILI